MGLARRGHSFACPASRRFIVSSHLVILRMMMMYMQVQHFGNAVRVLRLVYLFVSVLQVHGPKTLTIIASGPLNLEFGVQKENIVHFELYHVSGEDNSQSLLTSPASFMITR
jgi:hypothetical protein